MFGHPVRSQNLRSLPSGQVDPRQSHSLTAQSSFSWGPEFEKKNSGAGESSVFWEVSQWLPELAGMTLTLHCSSPAQCGPPSQWPRGWPSFPSISTDNPIWTTRWLWKVLNRFVKLQGKFRVFLLQEWSVLCLQTFSMMTNVTKQSFETISTLHLSPQGKGDILTSKKVFLKKHIYEKSILEMVWIFHPLAQMV